MRYRKFKKSPNMKCSSKLHLEYKLHIKTFPKPRLDASRMKNQPKLTVISAFP